MPGGEVVKIEGLRELRLGLKAMDRGLPREIRKAGNEAVKLVVDIAKPRVPTGPEQGGHAIASIKPASTQSGAGVAEGGARYPYMAWLDFGGTINKHTSNPTVRPFIKHGRYIWAAFAENRELIIDRYREGMSDLSRESGLGRFG
jgi:hypothetical protein